MAQNWIIDRGMLLMDEPFSALDVHTRQRMETRAARLWEAGSCVDGRRRRRVAGRAGSRSRKTVVFVTHDLEEAIALADEVVVLSAGPASRVVRAAPGDARAAARSDGAADARRRSSICIAPCGPVLREEVIKSQRRGARA